jgi:hypothetical protein
VVAVQRVTNGRISLPATSSKRSAQRAQSVLGGGSGQHWRLVDGMAVHGTPGDAFAGRTVDMWDTCQQPGRFHNPAFAMPPERFNRVEPGALDRQQATDDAPALASSFDLPRRQRDAIPGPFGWFLDAGYVDQLSTVDGAKPRSRSSNERPARAS